MGWETSTRRRRLPRDWPKRVARTRELAHDRCQAHEHEPDCDGWGSQCDHHVAGDDHSQANLRWLSEPCHKAKTRREARAAHAAYYAAAKRPPERHPGV